ncbi:hypothetical protein Hamer_G011531 [Homarus americanus]|uniref:Uncharacterized protein n=1 Tax=Homarus americanus TaxID=6706 RepID=A0A8J5MZC1_HOMAM|nr:hypothetical protein Hamer_G011531 [Homarus americanus]
MVLPGRAAVPHGRHHSPASLALSSGRRRWPSPITKDGRHHPCSTRCCGSPALCHKPKVHLFFTSALPDPYQTLETF